MISGALARHNEVHDESELKIVVAGTLPPPICGTTVSLKLLIDELTKLPNVQTLIVNTSGIRGSGWKAPFRYLLILASFTKAILASDVVTLHLSPLAVKWLGPIALLISRIIGRPVILRLFGGQDFRDFSGFGARIHRWVTTRCDVYLAQTQRLVNSAKSEGARRVEWYPTSRPKPKIAAKPPSKQCCRFVFLGWVKESKGVPLILEVANQLPARVCIDVFGPFDGMSESDFAPFDQVNYRGIIKPGEALEHLHRYDALVLPTHWEGEGYPGVVLEAYLAGIPVITTRWRDIPEIVDSDSGILMEPHSSTQLLDAVKTLHDDAGLYHRLAAGAARKGQQFTGDVWAARLVDICRNAHVGKLAD